MYRIWPDPDPRPLDDAALIEAYRPAGPMLRVNFVSSTDGAVEVGGYSRGLQTPADNRVFALLRMFADGLVVGAGTVRHEGYGGIDLDEDRRAWRVEHGLPPYPRMVIVSRRLDLDPTHPALAQASRRPVVLTCGTSPPDRRTALSATADVLVHGQHEVDLRAGFADLRDRGLGMMLCEGGPHLMGSLTAAGLVDELCLTLAPLLAGAGAGRITAGPPGTGLGDQTGGAPAASDRHGARPRRLALGHVLCDGDGTLLLRYTRATGPDDGG